MKSDEEQHDDLWQLLGKAREPKASPFFARNILRAIREHRSETPGVLAWLKRRWQLSALTAGGVALVAFALIPRTEQPDPLLLAAQEVSASPDYQVINDLDELLDSERNSIWLEASAY